MTDAQRIDLLDTEPPSPANGSRQLRNNTTATTVGIPAIKIDQLVDALLHPASNGGRAK